MSEWRNHRRREEREGSRWYRLQEGKMPEEQLEGWQRCQPNILVCASWPPELRRGAQWCSYQVTAKKTFFQRRKNSHILPKHPVCGWPSAWFSFYSGTNVPWLGDRIVDWSLLWLEGHPKSPHLFCLQSRGWGVASQLHRFHTWVRERSGLLVSRKS